MLRLDHLSTSYGHTIIGHDLCATLPPGTLTALLGPNGSGKSTLLRTLAGLQPPLTGEATWQGSPLSGLSPRGLARTLSIVLTTHPEADALTAGEVVEMGRIPYAHGLTGYDAGGRRHVERALQLTGTDSLRHRPVSRLSDGERQRVFLAKSLAQATPLILLDEPTAFLDFPTKAATFRLLARLAGEEGKTILVSTHDVELALQFARRLWLLRPGGITEGTPRELAANGEIGRFFQDGARFDPLTMRFHFRA